MIRDHQSCDLRRARSPCEIIDTRLRSLAITGSAPRDRRVPGGNRLKPIDLGVQPERRAPAGTGGASRQTPPGVYPLGERVPSVASAVPSRRARRATFTALSLLPRLAVVWMDCRQAFVREGAAGT